MDTSKILFINKSKMKNLYSILAVISFCAIALASSVSTMHCSDFAHTTNGEIENDGRDYIELNDGKKIYGKGIKNRGSLIGKDIIMIEDQKFNVNETRGYLENGLYYRRIEKEYAKRIVHGKLNIYYTESSVMYTTTSASGSMRTHYKNLCFFYIQAGDNGEVKLIESPNDIIKYVKDCPLAVEMIKKSTSKIRQSIRKNAYYLNNLIILYNNGCK